VTIDPVMMAGHFIVDVPERESAARKTPRNSAVGHHRLGAGRQTPANVHPRHRPAAPAPIRSYDDDTRAKDDRGRSQRTAKAIALDGGRARRPDVKITAGREGRGSNDAESRGARRRRGAEGGVLATRPGAFCRRRARPARDYSEFIIAGRGRRSTSASAALDPKAVAEATAMKAPLPGNHSPEFAPVPEPTIRTGTTGDEPRSAGRPARRSRSGGGGRRFGRRNRYAAVRPAIETSGENARLPDSRPIFQGGRAPVWESKGRCTGSQGEGHHRRGAPNSLTWCARRRLRLRMRSLGARLAARFSPQAREFAAHRLFQSYAGASNKILKPRQRSEDHGRRGFVGQITVQPFAYVLRELGGKRG